MVGSLPMVQLKLGFLKFPTKIITYYSLGHAAIS